MVDVRDLVKVYPGRRGASVRALQGVSFSCGRGEVLGLLGRNGAGKTTALRVLATVLRPTSGSVEIDGHDVVEAGHLVRSRIGFVTGDTRLYDRLTGREVLSYFGRLQGVPAGRLDGRIDAVCERFGLSAFLGRRVGQLSSGQRQRLSLARALVHEPSVIILDEPTVGLDVLSARETIALVEELAAEGRAVLFSTHILAEVQRICHRVAVIDRGRLLACETIESMRARCEGDLERAFVEMIMGAAALA